MKEKKNQAFVPTKNPNKQKPCSSHDRHGLPVFKMSNFIAEI